MAAITLQLGVDNARYKTGLEQARQQSNRFRKDVTKSFKSVAAVAGVSLGATGIIVGIDRLTEKYDRLAKLRRQFGNIDAEFFQKAAFAAEQNGTEVESLAKGLNRLLLSSREAAAGSEKYAEALNALGLEAESFAALNQEEQFRAIADAVQQSTDADKAKTAVLELMGTRAADLIPLLQQGSKGFDELGGSVNALSADQLEQIEEFRDLMNKFKTEIASLTAGALSDLLRKLTDALEKWNRLFNPDHGGGTMADTFELVVNQQRMKNTLRAQALTRENFHTVPRAGRGSELVMGDWPFGLQAESAMTQTAARNQGRIMPEVFEEMLVELRELNDKEPVEIKEAGVDSGL